MKRVNSHIIAIYFCDSIEALLIYTQAASNLLLQEEALEHAHDSRRKPVDALSVSILQQGAEEQRVGVYPSVEASYGYYGILSFRENKGGNISAGASLRNCII